MGLIDYKKRRLSKRSGALSVLELGSGSASRQRLPGAVGKASKGLGVMHGDVGQDLAIQLDPGQLLVRNDDALFPAFRGHDLASRGPATLVHRAQDGARVDALGRQAAGLAVPRDAVAILAPFCPATVVALWAATAVGAANPLNLLFTREAIAAQLAAVGQSRPFSTSMRAFRSLPVVTRSSALS